MVNIGAGAEKPLLQRGKAMKTEPLQQISLPISREPKDRHSGANPQAIQACYDLLSSGQPLSEILVALKQLGRLNNTQSESGGAPDHTQTFGPVGEIGCALPPRAMAQVAEPIETGRSLVLLNVEASQQRGRDERRSRRPVAVALFCLIPAMSLMVVEIGGKLLIDADLFRNSGTAMAGIETVAPMPAITEVGRTEPDQSESARESVSQAALNPPANNQDRGSRIHERPTGKPSSRLTSRPTQQPHTEFYRSSPKEWRIPTRLTDGL